ncbi:MAG TPA: MFS transporter [Pseudonocardiaceae bacterium]|nr:MFS transporter [Pseudonocardiaceae bacterium]
MLLATINSSIVLIALPDIFKGIHINPLDSGNTSYLLWMMMGFLVVTAVLVVSFGRLGDMYGRARMYNLGFAVFTISSVLLAVTWMDGSTAALWLIGWRVIQGIGGAFLMANSSAILTDAFPANQRGMAMGLNGVAAIAGSFLGLLIGGVLAPVNWHLIFLVSVPFGVLGTIWAYLKLHDIGHRQPAKMDWWGNITFAVGLIAILVAITYGIQPYHGHSMGWTSPLVLTGLIGGAIVLIIFGVIELKVDNPLFRLSLFRIRSFSLGNLANLMASLGRGGLQFILIIWLQGVWLPQHGYSFSQTPLWAGIYMLPMTVGFLASAPLAGTLSDRLGTRVFATIGMAITAVTFGLLIIIPVNFNYWAFAGILVLNGLGMGMFAAPNRSQVMNSLPGDARGVGAGMTATFQNAAMVLSIGMFFSLIIAGLSANLPSAMFQGLSTHGVPTAAAAQLSHLPAVAVLFAAFLGYNPIQQLLGSSLHGLSASQSGYLTGRGFFPNLISGPFHDGLVVAFWFAIVVCVIAAVASLASGSGRPVAALAGAKPGGKPAESLGQELAGVAGEASGGPAELVDESLVDESAGAAPLTGPVLTGQVLGVGGSPVAGAVVTVTAQDGRQAGRMLVRGDGRYAVGGLWPGRYTVIVSAPGADPQAATVTMVDGQPVRRDFALAGLTITPTGGVIGAVRSVNGRPLADATVTAVTADGTVVAAAITDADGHYRLDGLPDGEYTVVASQFPPVATSVRVGTGGEVELDLSLGGETPARPVFAGVTSN